MTTTSGTTRRTAAPPRPEPRGLRAMFLFRRAPRAWHIGLRTSLSIVIPALVGLLAGQLGLGLLASIGGFASLYGGGRPYRNRARLLLGIAVAQAVAVSLGIWADTVPWLGVVAVTVIAVVATWVTNAFSIQPGAYQFALLCATGTAMHARNADPVQSGLLVLSGGLLACVLQLSGALVDRHGPERQVVADAADAVADFVDAIDTPDADEQQHRAAVALHRSWMVLVNQQPRRRKPPDGLLRLREISRNLQLILADALRRRTPDPGAAGRARQLGWQARSRSGPRQGRILYALPLGQPSVGQLLRGALAPGSRSLLVIVRVAVAALLSGVLGSALGLSHAYWAVATAVLVLSSGFDQRRTVQRGLERSAGTALGVGVAALILALRPADLVLIAVIGVVVYGAQLLVQRNYAAAAVLITCSALLMSGGDASRAETNDLLVARALDTVIGCGVALTVFALISRKAAAAWVPSALADTLDAAAAAVDQLTPETVTSEAGMLARRILQQRVIRLADTFTNNLNGFPRQRDTAERLWPVVVAGERLAYRVLAEGWRLQEAAQAPGSEGGRRRLSEAGPPPSEGLRTLARAVRTGSAARGVGDVPSFLSRDVGDLRRMLQR